MISIQVITGPTGSGKTALALENARDNSLIEIINADASLLYRGFDIGTAKPSPQERAEILHHLIDILEPSQAFSAADFSGQARNIIREVIRRKHIPLIVGGTGLYINALFFGLATTDVADDSLLEARKEYERRLIRLGFDSMLEELKSIDPILYEQIVRERNPRRLQRAWEFYIATGTSLGEARQQKSEPFEYQPKFIILLPEREELRTRIADRIDQMLDSGWLEEVSGLIKSGITDDMPAMKAIGYRVLADVVRGKKELIVAREEIINQTRQYAKRQVTWMKKYANIS